jgi:hypothetical protein
MDSGVAYMKPKPPQKRLLLLIALAALLVPFDLCATPGRQTPDIVIHNGIRYSTQNDPLFSYLRLKEERPGGPRPLKEKWRWIATERTIESSALLRGYIATYEIVDNELILKNIVQERGRIFSDYTISILGRFLSTAGVSGSVFKMDWFTGTLILGGGKVVYGGYFEVIYEYHLQLKFENGILVKETRMDYMEYLLFLRERGRLGPMDMFSTILKRLRQHAEEKGVSYNGENAFFATTSDDSASIEITGYVGAEQTVHIPSQLRGLPVTTIGSRAFASSELTNVTIPKSVTAIGNYAFAGNQLTGVTIPNSVTNIGNDAFAGNQLTGITIPNSVTAIGVGAFSRNRLTDVTIPNAITVIEDWTFSSNSFTNFTIPEGVIAIGSYAFYYNELLADITISGSVTSIGKMAFWGTQLTTVTIGANVVFDGCFLEDCSFDRTYHSQGKAAGTYILRNGVWVKYHQ